MYNKIRQFHPLSSSVKGTRPIEQNYNLFERNSTKSKQSPNKLLLLLHFQLAQKHPKALQTSTNPNSKQNGDRASMKITQKMHNHHASRLHSQEKKHLQMQPSSNPPQLSELRTYPQEYTTYTLARVLCPHRGHRQYLYLHRHISRAWTHPLHNRHPQCLLKHPSGCHRKSLPPSPTILPPMAQHVLSKP